MKLKTFIATAFVLGGMLFYFSCSKKSDTNNLSASFSFTGNNQPAPDTVRFTNTSTQATSYLWTFGDNSATTADTNPVHIYASAGTYTVQLNAINGSNTSTVTHTVIVSAPSTTNQYLCTSKSGVNSYFPLAVGNKWVMSILGGPDTYTVTGTTTFNSKSYFVVDIHFGSGQSDDTRYFRVDGTTNNIYEYLTGTQTEDLFLPAAPTVNEDLGTSFDFEGFNSDRTVISITASVSTTSCLYTNCLEIHDTNGTEYFVPGLGVVRTPNYQLSRATLN